MVVSRMLLAAPRSLGGTKHRNNWLIRRRERLQAAIWLERTQRRDTKSAKEEHRWIGGRDAGRNKGTSTEQRRLCVRNKTTVRLASERVSIRSEILAHLKMSEGGVKCHACCSPIS